MTRTRRSRAWTGALTSLRDVFGRVQVGPILAAAGLELTDADIREIENR